MYLIGNMSDENLDSLKPGDEFQIISLFGGTSITIGSNGFIPAPEVPSHQSVWGQFPYRGARSLEHIEFRTLLSRTKRTLTWDFRNWRTGEQPSTMRYHDFRMYGRHYWIIKKISIVDLDEDDDDCI